MKPAAITGKMTKEGYHILFVAEKFEKEKITGKYMTPNKKGVMYELDEESVNIDSNLYSFDLICYGNINELLMKPNLVDNNPYMISTIQ